MELKQKENISQEASRAARIYNSHVENLLGTELPDYFKFAGEYAQFQFSIGWTKRGLIDGRLKGSFASHLEHPDIGVAFEKLSDGVKNFVYAMSTMHVVLYASLEPRELVALREFGKSDSLEVTVEEPLLSKANEAHHIIWMLTRDMARISRLSELDVRDHTAHKERSQLTAEEIAADNPQVQSYAIQLANMPDEMFDWLLNNTVVK